MNEEIKITCIQGTGYFNKNKQPKADFKKILEERIKEISESGETDMGRKYMKERSYKNLPE